MERMRSIDLMKEKPFSWFANALNLPSADSHIVRGVEIDSQKIQKGNLFFALKGKKVDGHSFLGDVALLGAAGAVVDKSYTGESFGLPLLKVDDVTAALQKLAKQELEERKTPLIAVTGSVGKTTTKEFLATLLEGKFRLTKTAGNSNSQVTMPMTILNAPDTCDLFVIEMGMTGPGEIARLVEITSPTLSLITRIGPAHVGYFAEGEVGVAKAKAEIFSHPKTRFGLYNAANHAFEEQLKTGNCEKLTFAYDQLCARPADFLLRRVGDQFQIEAKGETALFSLPFQATHLCEDFIASTSAARLLGVSWEEIIHRAKQLCPFQGRFERVERSGTIFINDAYNANPLSMRAAFANLPRPEKNGRRIAVLGTMVELGAQSEQYHRAIGEEAAQLFDHLLCFGVECLPMVEIFRRAGRPVDHFSSVDEMRERLFDLAREGDVVLIKGSNSTKLWQILN